MRDQRLAEREGWAFGAKLVRGAYIEQENAEAAEAGRASPIWGSLQETEENYHAVIREVLSKHRRGNQVVVASHNADSLLFTAQTMSEFGLRPQGDGVMFAQLLGMADGPSTVLASHGYQVFKYVPYGPIAEVVPYLLRRTQENSTLLSSPSVGNDNAMIVEELFRRSLGMDITWLRQYAPPGMKLS